MNQTSSVATRPAAGSVPARLAAIGAALLLALPLAMWIANRSAPLMLALAAAAFCAAALAEEGWRPSLHRAAALLRGPIGLALSGFLLWSLVTIAWSHRPLASLAAWGEFALPLTCGVAIAASGRFRPGPALGRALAIVVAVAAVMMMAELATGLAVRRALDIGRQVTYMFNRPVLTCLILAPVALAALPWQGPSRRTSVALALPVVLAVAWACLGSESGAAGLGLLAMAAAAGLARLAPRLTLAAVAAGFTATMALAPVAGRVGEAVLPVSLHERLANSHSRERVDIWLSFGEAAQARPLLGAGFGASAALDRHAVALAVSPPRRLMLAAGHPHNAPLQAWVETGALGALLLTSAGLACLARLRRLAATDLAPRVAVFASAFIVASVAHGAWQGWWIAALATAVLWLCAPPPDATASPPTETEEVHHG